MTKLGMINEALRALSLEERGHLWGKFHGELVPANAAEEPEEHSDAWKVARVGLEGLSSAELDSLWCWFCDGCFVEVDPGGEHRCTRGSELYPPAEETG